KKLFARIFGKKDKKDERTDAEKLRDVKAATTEAEALANSGLSGPDLERRLPPIKAKYKLTSLSVVHKPDGFQVVAEINPRWLTKVYPEGETKYTIKEGGKRVLRPEYRGGAKIRRRMYSASNNAPLQRIVATKIAPLVRQKNATTGAWEPAPNASAAKFWEPTPGTVVSMTDPRTRPTVEHSLPVVGHWNTGGNDIDQGTRIAWFRFTGREDTALVVPFHVNRTEGDHGAGEYTHIVGDNFTEPGE
ncbi:MAG TPA: hypothetical protein VF625_04080, partial [Longimicrobium sp.]